MRRRPSLIIKVPIFDEDREILDAMPPYGRGAWLKEVVKRRLQPTFLNPQEHHSPDTARQIEEEIADWLRNDIVPELIEIIREEVRNEVRRALEGQVSAVVTEDSSDEAEESSDPIETWQPTKAWIESLRG